MDIQKRQFAEIANAVTTFWVTYDVYLGSNRKSCARNGIINRNIAIEYGRLSTDTKEKCPAIVAKI